MLEAGELRAAVEAGVLDAQQADRLAAFLASRGGAAESTDPDDERFKLIGGFNDIFVTLGIGLVVGAMAFALKSAQELPYAGVALAWALAEVFTRRFRMALPSIVLAFLFAVSALGVAGLWLSGSTSPTLLRYGDFASVIALIGAVCAALHYWRFRVPVDVGIATALLLAAAAALLDFAAPGFVGANSGAVALVCGLAAFAFAMRFDLSDPRRVTHRSDVAFWLHLVAAPLVAHGTLAGVIGASRTGEHAGEVLLVTLAFTLVALIVDRRALIVSALTYAGGAIAYILKGLNLGGRESESLTITILLLGAAILLLSVGWRWLRALIVPRLPLGALVARLPPIHAA